MSDKDINERFWIAISGAGMAACSSLMLDWLAIDSVAWAVLGVLLFGLNVAVTTWLVMRGYPQ